MGLPVVTLGTVAAISRHVLSYAMGAITATAALHLITQTDANQLTNALQQVATGVATMAGGLATLVSMGSAFYAAWSATPKSQAKSVVANVPGTVIVTTPELANATPHSPEIMSHSNVEVRPL